MSYVSRDGLRVGLIILGAIAQIAAGAAPRLLGWEHDISSRSASLSTPIVPAGWAFSIWGIIFAGCVAFAIYAAMPRQLERLLLRRVGWLAAALFLMAAAWEIWVPLQSLDWVSSVAIFVQLGLCLAIVFALKDEPLAGWDVALVKAPLFLFAGWISAAAFVGLPAVLRHHGVETPDPAGIGVILTLAATIFVLAVSVMWSGAGWIYAAPVIWAFLAVADRNFAEGCQTIAYAAVGFAAGLAAATLMRLATRRLRRR